MSPAGDAPIDDLGDLGDLDATVDGGPDGERPGTGARLGRVLRAGVLLSATLLVVGLGWGAVGGDLGGGSGELADRLDGHGRPPSSIGAVVGGLRAGRPEALVTLGLLVLVATPIVRVAVAGWSFRRDGDRPFGAIAVLVLVLLAASFVADAAG